VSEHVDGALSSKVFIGGLLAVTAAGEKIGACTTAENGLALEGDIDATLLD
jgi:hypothetical protein